MLHQLNSDSVLHIFSFLSAIDCGITKQSCKRFFYLLERFQRDCLEPELVACSSSALSKLCEWKRIANEKTGENSSEDDKMLTRSQSTTSNKTPFQVIRHALSEMRSPPNVAFCFYSTPKARLEFLDSVERLLPSQNVRIISAMSLGGIQSNIHMKTAQSNPTQSTCNGKMNVESDSDFCCMIGSFRNAYFVPLHIAHDEESQDDDADQAREGVKSLQHLLHDEYMKTVDQNEGSSPTENQEKEFWKVFILYIVGGGYHISEDFLQQLQNMYPSAAIVGGVVDEGDNCALPFQSEPRDDTTNHALTNVKNGIFGLAIGGAVPVRSIVSRGLRSTSSGEVGPSSSEWLVEESSFIHPTDENYPYDGPSHLLKPLSVIHSVRNPKSNTVISAKRFVVNSHEGNRHPQYIGVKKVNINPDDEDSNDGFEVQMFNGSNFIEGNIAIMADANVSSEKFFENGDLVDLFELDAKACVEDMENTLIRLKAQLKNEKLLGSIMYSCNGRGPSAGLLGEEMSDATRFANHFDTLPCVGLYAGGEIGPRATFGNRDIFRKGKVALQGFTAVFAVFVVPKKEKKKYFIDDSDESIQTFLRSNFESL